jgi:hypothetical protein
MMCDIAICFLTVVQGLQTLKCLLSFILANSTRVQRWSHLHMWLRENVLMASRSGADKVSIGGDAVEAVLKLRAAGGVPSGDSSIETISWHYGAQAVVVSIDPRRVWVHDRTSCIHPCIRTHTTGRHSRALPAAWINALPMLRQHSTNALPMLYRCLTNASAAFYQCLANALSVPYQRFGNILPMPCQCSISALPTLRQHSTNALPMLY